MDEWKIDEQGRRYRMLGGLVKEYEMMVSIDGLQIPQSQLADYNRRKGEATTQRAQPSMIPPRLCPYKTGLSNDCSDKCAWYTKNGCVELFRAENAPTIKPEGKTCPLSGRVCYGKRCGLWFNGCIRTGI